MALAMLVRRYEFRLDPAGPPIGMTTGATIHTSAGLRMFLMPRTHDEPVRAAPCPAANEVSVLGLPETLRPHTVAIWIRFCLLLQLPSQGSG